MDDPELGREDGEEELCEALDDVVHELQDLRLRERSVRAEVRLWWDVPGPTRQRGGRSVPRNVKVVTCEVAAQAAMRDDRLGLATVVREIAEQVFSQLYPSWPMPPDGE